MSPIPAMVPSGRREVIPEMNTSRPCASAIVAWEKWPLGWRIFGDVICFLGMTISFPTLPGVLLVRVPIRLHGVVGSVVNLDHDGFFVRNGRPVHIAFGIAVEAAGREHDAGFCVFISAGQAD